MTKVTWQRLILRGFGRYRHQFELEFGANPVLILPNESGKSTLVAGLVAVIFGLPASADASKFGQARYRNWDDPPEFSGELYFSVDTTDYHLTRNFVTHQICLRYRAPQGWVQLPQATGTDNPSATRPFRAYHHQLQQLFGISSLDLFLTTFCITQPLPTPEGLDAAVQGLLAGAGGRVARVQQLLEDDLKGLTRFYGPPLGRARDGNKDRQLEEVQAEIQQLQEAMAVGQVTSDELQSLQTRLAQLSGERQTKQARLTAGTASLQAAAEWQRQAERYRHGLEQQQRLEQALQQGHHWQAEAAQLQQRLHASLPFAAVKLDWEAFLEAGVQQQRELLQQQRELEELEAALLQLEASQERRLHEYYQRQQRLAAALDRAQQYQAELKARESAQRQLEQTYQARFGDLQLAPQQLLTALRQQQPTIGRSGKRSSATKASALPLISWLVGLCGAIASYQFGGRTAGSWGLVASLLCLLLGGIFPLVVRSSGKTDASGDVISQALHRCSDWDATRTFLEELLEGVAKPLASDLATAQASLTRLQTELAACQEMLAALNEREADGRAGIEGRIAMRQAQIVNLEEQLATARAQVVAAGAAAPVEWSELQQAYRLYQGLERRLQEIQRLQQALWTAQQVEDQAELTRRALDLKNSLAAIRLAWQSLIDAHPALPPIASGDLIAAHQPQEQTWQEQLQTEVTALQEAVAALQEEEAALLRRQAQLVGRTPLNLAVAQDRLQELLQQEERLQLEIDALSLAYRELEAARIDYSTSHRQRLADQVSSYFSLITGQPQRRVELDSDFAVTLRGAAGQVIHPAQLSQGARDQLYLSLRLAIADLLAADVRLPLILDDPFVNCDSERLERIRLTLAKVAESRQIWLLTHNPQFSSWGI